MDCSLSGSSVHGISQARVQEWVAISFSGDLPNQGIEPGSPALQADSLPAEPPGKPWWVKDELTLINWCIGEINIHIFVWILFISSRGVYAFFHPLSTIDITF